MKTMQFQITAEQAQALLEMLDPGESATITIAENNMYDVTVTWDGDYTPVFDFTY